MTFSTFSSILEEISTTTLRNTITVILANLFKQLEPSEVEPACWLLLGRILPPYEGLEFQFAEKMMLRTLASASKSTPESVFASYKIIGDLATVASTLLTPFAPATSTLSITQVYEKLSALAHDAGQGSQERKINQVVALFTQLDPLSLKFIVRIILTKLRLGFSDMTLLDALSWAKTGSKSDRPALEDAYQNKHDIGKLAASYIKSGLLGLENFDIELGIPIQPALCQRLKTAVEMIDKMTKVYAEAKYDGTRVQIHVSSAKDALSRNQAGKPSWSVRTFTRTLEESSAMFPELEQDIRTLGSHSYILDCEAVGKDPTTGKMLPFQETIQRKRKHDVSGFAKKIPLIFYVFDILYLDGRNLTKLPLYERKVILSNLLGELRSPFLIESEKLITTSPDELRLFHKTQLDAGFEGAVVKQFDSVYQPGRKGWSWVKFKEIETSAAKLSDTIDALVLGYWRGKGKRTNFGIGSFLIGILDDDGKYKTISKVGTGLTDSEWRQMVSRGQPFETSAQPNIYEVPKNLIPDVWLEPGVIVEIAADELTTSPLHSAGIALRFPRLVRFRDDKKIDNVTTLSEVKQIRATSTPTS